MKAQCTYSIYIKYFQNRPACPDSQIMYLFQLAGPTQSLSLYSQKLLLRMLKESLSEVKADEGLQGEECDTKTDKRGKLCKAKDTKERQTALNLENPNGQGCPTGEAGSGVGYMSLKARSMEAATDLGYVDTCTDTCSLLICITVGT